MAGKVLSIEITTHFIRGIEVDYLSKKPKVYKNFVIPTPTGTYTDGTVIVNDEWLTVLIKRLLRIIYQPKRLYFVLFQAELLLVRLLFLQ